MKILTKNIVGNRRRTIQLEEKALFNNVRIHNQKNDVFIETENGIIKKIHATKPTSFKGAEYDLSGKVVIPGAIDLHSIFREPGREDVETLETGSLAAANGGFTQVCILPSTEPPIDSLEMIEYVKGKTRTYLVDIHVFGALTKERKGLSIAPFAELAEEGAIGFTDGRQHVKSSKIMHIALTYLKMLNLPLVVKASDSDLTEKGQMHEGFMSTKLGFIGMPSIAEETIIGRDLKITEYVDGRIHFTNISTKRSVELLREAKARGIKATCDVAIHNLLNTDEALTTFDTNLKLDPPLREQSDLDALIEGLKDGTIDAISSSHTPHSWEEKEAEYIYAPFGAVSLETMIPLILDRFVNKGLFTLDEVVRFIHDNPAKIFNLKASLFEEGQAANFTILDLNQEYTIDKTQFLSKSNNTPYDGLQLKGNVVGVINNNRKYFK